MSCFPQLLSERLEVSVNQDALDARRGAHRGPVDETKEELAQFLFNTGANARFWWMYVSF